MIRTIVKFSSFLLVILSMPCVVAQDISKRDLMLQTVSYMSYKIKEEGANVTYLAMRGWAFQQLDSLKPALRDFNAAIELNPNDSELFFVRAEIKFGLRKFKESINDYNNAISLSHDSLRYYVARGIAYEMLKEYKLAERDYSEVLRLNSTQEFALRNRAILYCKKLNQREKGIEDWDLLLSKYPDPEYFFDRGRIFVGRGEFLLAIKDFNRAISLSPDNSKYYANRAYCFGTLKKYSDSFEDFSIALKLDNKDPFTYKYRGEIFLQMEKKNEACADFAKASELGLDVKCLLLKCKK